MSAVNDAEKVIPLAQRIYYQQGGFVLMKVDEIPVDAICVEEAELPDGTFSLGSGHFIRPVVAEK